MKEFWVVDKFGTYLREVPEANKQTNSEEPTTFSLAQKFRKPFEAIGRTGLGLGMLIASNHVSPPLAYAESDKKLQSSVQSIPIEGGVFITENGFSGFAVTGPMADVFRDIGGPSVWGQPISRPYRDDVGRENQAFEKGVVQISADGKGGVNVEYGNIFDELSKQGKDGWLDSVRQTPPPADWSSDAGKTWEGVVENHFLITDPYPTLHQFILNQPDWLNMYGLPISIQDYGAWISLRMQRSNLQLYTQDVPWASAGQILVANGGSVAKEAGGIIPEDKLLIQKIENGIVRLCSSWPTELSRILTSLPLPEGICLVIDTAAPPDEPTCSGACYRGASRVVWIVEAAIRPENRINTMAHEICHGHQHLTELQADPQRKIGWNDTPEGKAFINAYNSYIAGRQTTRLGNIPLHPWGDFGYYENFANICSDHYFPNPASTNKIVDNAPFLREFAHQWLPKR